MSIQQKILQIIIFTIPMDLHCRKNSVNFCLIAQNLIKFKFLIFMELEIHS